MIAYFTVFIVFANLFSQFEMRFRSENALFPHEKRANGHRYNDQDFPANPHYTQSDIFIYFPKNLDKSKAIQIVYYFHGWWNSIDSSLVGFNLRDIWSASTLNAIYVFPEGPYKSADSFAGKLEDDFNFDRLHHEIIDSIHGRLSLNNASMKIILSGHSGAYRAIAFILNKSRLYREQIRSVILLDALYGETENFAIWLVQDSQRRLLNICTKDGGTRQESFEFLADCQDWQISQKRIDESSKNFRIPPQIQYLLLDSDLDHNAVVSAYLLNCLNQL